MQREENQMMFDLQKASISKRISAFLLDGIFFLILVVGFAFFLSAFFGYDSYNQTLRDAYANYESKYGIVFDISEEQYYSMSEEDLGNYNNAYAELISDKEAMYAYHMVFYLTLVISTLSILLAFLILEFIIPIRFRHGQTLGKKIFGIGVMHTDGIQVTPMLLFIRVFLGKFTLETMIPVLIIFMIFFNMIGFLGTMIVGLILLLQIIFIIATRTNSLLHDILAKTVVIDMASQMIFPNAEELIAYKKKVHAEKVTHQTYEM